MKASTVGNVPIHQYVWIDSAFTHVEPIGFVPAVWFGIVSQRGRLWGCSVLLDSGALYRNVPAHALAFRAEPELDWTPKDVQAWDCYGESFSVVTFNYLADLNVVVECNAHGDACKLPGRYLFTTVAEGDGFSLHQEQAKEFVWAALDNGRLTIAPLNRVLFREQTLTRNDTMIFPTGLKRQDQVYRSESVLVASALPPANADDHHHDEKAKP